MKTFNSSIALLTAIFFACLSCNNPPTTTETPAATISSPVPISPQIPVDVDPALQTKLKAENDNFFALNQEFNKFSWQAFVAIFWPLNAEGKPMPNFTDQGEATWLTWKEAFEVYRKDGGVPAPWGSPRTGSEEYTSLDNHEDFRVYLSSETPAHKGSDNIADEEDQAFAGKLFDQNGNIVYYEVLLNEAEFNYLVDNKLYNKNGQIEFTSTGQIADFPKGEMSNNTVGAIEIKLAWKILTDEDYKERYFVNQGYIIDPTTEKLVPKDLGMIGFHISQKTPTGKQWVWSTFEHIDNLDQNVITKNNKAVAIHPTLYDPNCEVCPVNIDLYNHKAVYEFNQGPHGDLWVLGKDTNYTNTNVMKTQSKRMVDIPVRVQRLNEQMRAYFKSVGSVFQYYQLIDTQYPTDQDVAPAPNKESDYILAASVANKPGGNPNIAYLTNITMETFFQVGNQSASGLMEANPLSNIQIFGTESCMGCHSSAGIFSFDTKTNKVVQLPQLSGDFSWLLTQKAQWDKSQPIPGSE